MVTTLNLRGRSSADAFEQAIDALAALAPQNSILLVMDQEPLALYEFLEANEYRYEARSSATGYFEVRVWEGPPTD